eukprot:11923546-Ditylum_brightwellii.AAC.1
MPGLIERLEEEDDEDDEGEEEGGAEEMDEDKEEGGGHGWDVGSDGSKDAGAPCLSMEDGAGGTTLIDARNGFNELSRYAMLWTVRH